MKRASILIWLILVGCVTATTNAQSSHEEVLSLLQDNQFSEALDLIENFPKNDSPKLCYWRAVCLAAEDQTDAAIKSCQETVARWPDAESAKDASQLIEILENLDSNADQLAGLYLKAMDRFRKNDGVLQLESSYKTSEQTQCDFRFAIDFQKKRCELELSSDGTRYLQFQTNEQGSRWYQNDDQILEFKETFFPVLNFLIEKMPDDSFKINIAGSISSEAKAAESTWNDLLQREWFSTREGCRQFFVEHPGNYAIFPVQVKESDGVTVGSFATPDFENGGFIYSSREFDAGGVLSKGDESNIRLHVKPAADSATASMLEDFQWPDVKVVRQELDVPFIKQFAQSLANALSKQEMPGSDF